MVDEESNFNLNNSSFANNLHGYRPNRPLNGQQLILKLQTIWTNEKFSKDILKYEEEFVYEIKQLIESKDEELKKIESEKKLNKKEDAELIELDLDRVKFILKDYLRIRLMKIDKFIYYIVKNDLTNLLSKQEFQFAVDLFKMKRNFFNDFFYKKIPQEFNDFKPYPENEQMIISPPYNNYVCVKSNTYEPIVIKMKDIASECDDTFVFNREEVYSLPYNLIK